MSSVQASSHDGETISSENHTPVPRDDAQEILGSYLYRLAKSRSWFSDDPATSSAVAVRLARGSYALFPPVSVDRRLVPFEQSVATLNPEIAFTFNSALIASITTCLPSGIDNITLQKGMSVQVVESMQDLAHARPAQQACFVRLERTLVVWCDKVADFQPLVESFEATLVNFVWLRRARDSPTSSPSKSIIGTPASGMSTPDWNTGDPFSEKLKHEFSSADIPILLDDIERDSGPRPALLYGPIYTGLAFSINCCLTGLLFRSLWQECLYDGDYKRMVLMVVAPFQFAVCMFLCDKYGAFVPMDFEATKPSLSSVIGVLAHIFLPIGQMARNSHYYSGIAPVRLTSDLPHVTIVMPVYKEPLDDVLAPTIESLKVAIRTYELQGGTASIIVCEDGLQLVDATEAKRRRDFYERHNCAWVARHPENRAGRFKKSSNLNVMKGLSLEIEELMDTRRPTEEEELRSWEAHEEDSLYFDCFHEVVASTEGRVWAEGNIRIGDYILIVDSDTRIPRDSFLDAVSEMEQSPEVAILQQCSGTFLAGAGYFESGIAFFTQIVNFSISWTVANGNSAPFVGHNAFLRWSALQHQSFIDPADNKRKIWSESHVSEDFVMTTNLVSKGYITRWATYTNHEFLEGVSLSCVDELNRWQKYAWGCSEMVFNPLKHWFTRSPFSSLYRTFLRGPAPLAFKLSCTSYISSYWALAVGPVLCLSLYPVQGLFWPDLDGAWLPPLTTFSCVLAVFTFGGTAGLIISRYRSRDGALFPIAAKHIIWAPFFAVFFSGLQLHVFLALMAHMFSYDMRWSTTIKDIQKTTVFKEVPKVLKHFKYTYGLMGSFIIGVAIASTTLIPQEWRITDFAVMFPPLWTASAHILFPILLNPDITLFRY